MATAANISPDECRSRLAALHCCVILPTYNNANTITSVVESAKQWCNSVIVINDGSTDNTHNILQPLHEQNIITLIEYPDGQNRGKGYALKTALCQAAQMGFSNAITMDSDGQHFASDIPAFVCAAEENPNAMIIGARNLTADGMPGKNTFANKFSNFWFKVETLQTLADTQSGYRLYPLSVMQGIRFVTPRYEFEVESIVRLAWRYVKVMNIPINVVYPPDRVSHFRPLHDFTRISILNTILVIIALVYYYPKCFAKWIYRTLICTSEDALHLACAVGVGSLIGTLPIWGLQTIVALATAHWLRLNKVIVLAFSNVSLPPIIPFVLYGSLYIGALITGSEAPTNISNLSLENIGQTTWQYVVGAIPFAIITGLLLGSIAYIIIRIFRK